MTVHKPISFIETEENLAESKSRILVVDDDELTLTALELTLKEKGYDVLIATNAKEAFQQLRKSPPAIIICDYSMPDMNGIEVLRKAHKLIPDTIRILLTGRQDTQTVIEAINVGQVNMYLTKPWKTADLDKAVQESINQYKLTLENRVLEKLIISQHEKLKHSHQILKNELLLGAQIHEKLLLGSVPQGIPGLKIDVLSCPSQEIDGDFFDFYRPNDHLLDFVIGDVMGKGIAAALVGTAVKTQLMRFAAPYPMQIFNQESGWHNNILSPQEVLTQVHCSLIKQLLDLNYFVTLFYCRFQLQHQMLSYLDCGSAKPLHYKAEEGLVEQIEGENFPLGVVYDSRYKVTETKYKKGDIFIFYSDGVTEARSQSNELFGVERLIHLVKAHNDLQSKDLLDLIRKSVLNFTQKKRFEDDLTLVIIKIGEQGKPEQTQIAVKDFPSDLEVLSEVREFIRRFCAKAPGDTERLANEMQIIVNEAFCNIVKHGQLNKSTIQIKAELQKSGIMIQCLDQGLPFDPAIIDSPDFCIKKDSGYGWYIIKKLADQITYSQKKNSEDFNRLTLYKRYYLGDK